MRGAGGSRRGKESDALPALLSGSSPLGREAGEVDAHAPRSPVAHEPGELSADAIRARLRLARFAVASHRAALVAAPGASRRRDLDEALAAMSGH